MPTPAIPPHLNKPLAARNSSFPPPESFTALLAPGWHRRWAHKYTAIQELERRRQAAQHLLPFVCLFQKDYLPGWFHQLLCQKLDQFILDVQAKKSPRLIVQVPPRHGKSTIVSRCLPAFILGQRPDWEVICASYNQTLADLFGREVRDLLNDPIYRDLFPDTTLDASTNSVSYVRTTSKGSYAATGVGGALTGMGAHIMVIDDPIKNAEEANSETVREAIWNWYTTTARTRIAPGGGMILVMTRWHEDDLAGKIITSTLDNPDAAGWEILSFPAIATEVEPYRDVGEALHPERYDLKELGQFRAELGPRAWSSLFQQDPSPDEGLFFERAWIKRRAAPSLTDKHDAIWYIATDFAIGEKETNDFTCLLPFASHADGSITFASPVYARLNAFDIVERLCDMIERYKPKSVAVENMHVTKTLGPLLQKRMRERKLHTHIWTGQPHRDKQARASGVRGRMQQGLVYFVPGSDVDNLIESEVVPFPTGKHDDFVDCMSWAALMLDKLSTPHAKPAGPAPGPAEGSYDWLQARTQNRRHDDLRARHRPAPLRGRSR
jgi:predicted phage terminase large subunit-like protein